MDVDDRFAAAIASRYQIERELGQGGMAIVYLARDLKHRRQVALKVLRPELSNSLGAERFLQEIAISARLVHPNILPLHDSGEAAGCLYYVMPYVEGATLRGASRREAGQRAARRRSRARGRLRAGEGAVERRQHAVDGAWDGGRHAGLHESRAV
jgi:hypothetical protein